jgi:hypothetical protein
VVVLWGARRGDVQFGSRQDWRTHIPIGAPRVEVNSAAFFDVGSRFVLVGRGTPGEVFAGGLFEVVGLEGNKMGVKRLT